MRLRLSILSLLALTLSCTSKPSGVKNPAENAMQNVGVPGDETETSRTTGAPTAEQHSDVQLSEEDYGRLMNGVFEIVAPRLEEKAVVYDEPLPEHLLPFKLRKSPYRGIGTAFAIAPNRFVSAAHVFDLHEPSLVTPLALRDSLGKIYQIDLIHRYSQHRDLVEFSLKTTPPKVQPLTIAKANRIGEFVFTVGNALGDGIVTRSGYVTSFTPEPVDGGWNDIRYSAPASPGNSGGPLLNKKLEVVGIVVRRTESENLNFAIPIKELAKVTKAEFFLQDVKFEQFKKQLSRDWKFATKLPSTPPAITKLAHADYMDFQAKLYADFQKKFKNDIFPTSPDLKKWARDSLSYTLAGYIMKDSSDRWITTPIDWAVTQLEPYRSMVTEKGGDHADTVLFMLERPKKTPLADFFKNPKGILDTFLKQMNWGRNFAGRRIAIKSYGEPKYSAQWKDKFGRRWWSNEWTTAFDDRVLQLNCMTMPAGVFCIFNADPFSVRELSRVSVQRAVNRFLIDIYGKVSDWKEWNAMSDEWKQPALPTDVKATINNGLVWQAGAFKGKMDQKDFDDNAEIALSYLATPENIFKLRLRSVQIAEKDGDMQMGVGINYRPDEGGHPAYREVWDKMVAQRAPYNGMAQAQGKHSLIVTVLGREPSSAKDSDKIKQVSFATCGVLSSVGESQIKKICDDFTKGVELK